MTLLTVVLLAAAAAGAPAMTKTTKRSGAKDQCRRPSEKKTFCAGKDDGQGFLEGGPYEDLSFNHFPYLATGSLRSELALFEYPNGDVYVGPTDSKGRQHGFGKYNFSDGRWYVGTFEKGIMHGRGKYKTTKTTTWEGEMRGAQPEGSGKWFFSNGGVSVVTSVNGQAHGRGTYTGSNGDVHEVHWNRGKMKFSSWQKAPDAKPPTTTHITPLPTPSPPPWGSSTRGAEKITTPNGSKVFNTGDKTHPFFSLLRREAPLLVLILVVVAVIMQVYQHLEGLSWRGLLKAVLHRQSSGALPIDASLNLRHRVVDKRRRRARTDSAAVPIEGSAAAEDIDAPGRPPLPTSKKVPSGLECANCMAVEGAWQLDGTGFKCKVALGACSCHRVYYCSTSCREQHWLEGHGAGHPPEDTPVGPPNMDDESIPPPQLCCPITSECFDDPAIAADGETYERGAIAKWINEKKSEHKEALVALASNKHDRRAAAIVKRGLVSPMGHGKLAHSKLTPNRVVKRLAGEWRDQQQEKWRLLH